MPTIPNSPPHKFKIGDKVVFKKECWNTQGLPIKIGGVYIVTNTRIFGDNGGLPEKYVYHNFYNLKGFDTKNIPEDALGEVAGYDELERSLGEVECSK